MRHQSDLEEGRPSATKPPFAAIRLCRNPLMSRINPSDTPLLDSNVDYLKTRSTSYGALGATFELKSCDSERLDINNNCFQSIFNQ